MLKMKFIILLFNSSAKKIFFDPSLPKEQTVTVIRTDRGARQDLVTINYVARGNFSYLDPRFCRAPSIAMHSPVKNLALPPTKKTMSSATSLGSPIRPKLLENGWVTSMLRWIKASYWDSFNPDLEWMFVLTTPGFTLLTRMPLGARSTEAHLAIMSSAALDIQYVTHLANGCFPFTELTFTIDATLGCFSRYGTEWCISSNGTCVLRVMLNS
mmetsp:Transcript_17042/g.42595  ORF Transcript_17042/g.42595 Transcript_17042/m.42595 type:complete len:213 (-) Transcript_17042:1463-2101(-)